MDYPKGPNNISPIFYYLTIYMQNLPLYTTKDERSQSQHFTPSFRHILIDTLSSFGLNICILKNEFIRNKKHMMIKRIFILEE
jgi:hypothetical protein